MRYAVFFFVLLPASAETLHYVLSWPSGLSLGEATLTSLLIHDVNGKASHETLTSDFEIDASVPGFAIRDHYHSTAADGCSVKLDKTVLRGARKSEETVTFHQDIHTITRQTHGDGGKSDTDVPDCARDALTFLQFARSELAQGRLAPQQPVILGGAYKVRLEVAGTQTAKMAGKPVEADRVQVTIKGPASSFAVEILFARDAARTPVFVRIPLPLGAFTAELIH
jgi:hypothetical protein